jgi:hypothetical protein
VRAWPHGMTWLEVEGDVSAARQRSASARMCVMVWPRSSSCAFEQDVELQLDLRHPHPDPPMWATALPPLPSATEGGVCKPLTAHGGTRDKAWGRQATGGRSGLTRYHVKLHKMRIQGSRGSMCLPQPTHRPRTSIAHPVHTTLFHAHRMLHVSYGGFHDWLID